MRKRYRKYQYGGVSQLKINAPTMPTNFGTNFDSYAPYRNFGLSQSATSAIQGTGNTTFQQAGGQALNALSGQLSTYASQMFGDSEAGQAIGGIVGSGVGSAFSTLGNNLLKGTALANGLGQNIGSSLAGAGIGVGASYLGKGVTNILGNTRAARGVGAGLSSGVGTFGGLVAGNAINGKNLLTGLVGSGGGMNIASMAGQAIGAGLQAAFGPSHAYQGKYGKITQGMDTAYDAIQSAIGFVPGWGQLVSGLMAVNKGLTNVFGSTDGMTKQDAILGSAWAGPLNWLNMAGARTTDTFKNQSWQNQERTDSFMQNAFGTLGQRFDKAREEAGKTYGTFSRKAFKRARNNINFANNAWGKILDMTDQNEYQGIRTNDMTSINNQRYAQMIQGGWQPIERGKNGMKILSFATTGGYQDTGMRLLSRAALNSSGMRILSNAAI